MKASKQIINFIEKYEEFKPKVYKCPAGKNTIGYGHNFNKFTKENYKNLIINEYVAQLLLIDDLKHIEKRLNKLNDICYKLIQCKFDALVSLIFNWGIGNFNASKGLTNLIKRDDEQALIEFFSKEKGVVKVNGKFSNGLYNRRQEELKIWHGQYPQ